MDNSVISTKWNQAPRLACKSGRGSVTTPSSLTYLSGIVVVSALLAGCAVTPPAHTTSWLTYKYNNSSDVRDTAEAIAYYCAIGVDRFGCAQTPPNPQLSFLGWYGTYYQPILDNNGSNEAHGIYANLGDLRIGRDMHCVQSQSGQQVSCYVRNFGPPPYDAAQGKINCEWAGCDIHGVPFRDFPQVGQAVFDAVQRSLGDCLGCPKDLPAPFATVAMTFDAATGNGANTVKFYTFDASGELLLDPALDGEGPKTNPQMCMACHGGTYDASIHAVTGASFLPFDVFYFQYVKEPVNFPPNVSLQTGHTFSQQTEQFRQLNAIVKATSSS